MLGLSDDDSESSEANRQKHIPDTFSRLKRFIASSGITWKERGAELGDVHSRTYVVTGWPKEAQAHFLYQLYSDSSIYYNASLHYDPYEKGEAVERLAEIEDQLADKTRGDLAKYIPNTESLEETRQIVKETKRAIENDGETLFDISISVTAYAASEENIEGFDSRIREILETESNMELIVPEDYPDLAHISSSPLAKPALRDHREEASQLALGETVGATFPFIEDTFTEPEGIVYGLNTANGTGIMVDIFNRNNGYNKLVIGDIGSGKSFSTGAYLLRHYVMNPDDNIVIIDPMSGFAGVTKALDGERVIINGTETINPLQIEPHNNPEDIEGSPYNTKLDEVRWFFNRFFNQYSTDGLSASERAPLDRAIQVAYKRKGITEDPATHDNESPTIRDVIDVLEDIANNPENYAASTSVKEMEQWEKGAADLLMAMEPFREGNELHNLVGKTDFEISPEVPTYIDMSQLDGKEDLGLMMKIVFSMLYEQVKDYEGRSIICMDEAHKIIDDPEEADHWAELFRHSRHHDLSIWLLSQEFEDFFQAEDGEGANEAAKTMASLCMVQQIHRVSSVNRPLAKDALGLTDDHIDFIETAVPGEAGEGYTTALLNINDAGYLGLKVIATPNEDSIIDYEPGQDWGDGEYENTLPEDTRIKRALDVKDSLKGTRPPGVEAQAKPQELPDDAATGEQPQLTAASDGSGTELPAVGEDPIIQELIDDIPIHHFHPKVKERMATRLIEDPSTPYVESQRDLILSALATQEGVSKLHKPEVIDVPAEDGAVQITINQAALDQSETEANIEAAATQSPEQTQTVPDEKRQGDGNTSPWVLGDDETDADNASVDAKPAADGRPEIEWSTRVEEHVEAIRRLSREEIVNMADILSVDRNEESPLHKEIAKEHARREVRGVGPTAPIGAIKEITRTLTWGVENILNESLTTQDTSTQSQADSELSADHAVDINDTEEDSDGTDDESPATHDDTVPYQARKQAHEETLGGEEAQVLKNMARALGLSPTAHTDKEKLIATIASEHAQREIADNGMRARVQPRTQIERSIAMATTVGGGSETGSSSGEPSGEASNEQSEPSPVPSSATPTAAPTTDRHFAPIAETTSPPSFTDRKEAHYERVAKLTPRHREYILSNLSETASPDVLDRPARIDQIATAHAMLEMEAGSDEAPSRLRPTKRIKESTPLPPINFSQRKQRYAESLNEYSRDRLVELYTTQLSTAPPQTASAESIAGEIAGQIARKEMQAGTEIAPVALEDHFPTLVDNNEE